VLELFNLALELTATATALLSISIYGAKSAEVYHASTQ